MLPKKNSKADLNKKSLTFFLIGLVFILFTAWRAIELKTCKSDIELDCLSVNSDDEEDIPITDLKITPPPPPPPPPAPQMIEIVEDEEEVEETVIESTETDQEEIIEVDDIDVEEEDDDLSVLFAVTEDIPLFPGCEKVKKSKRRQCFQEKINRHIVKNFRYPEIAQEMGIQGRVYISFIIDKQGNIIAVTPRGPDKNLEKEAKSIIDALPKMIPGKQRGRPVRVPYSIPITFKLQ
ncbi:MAG: energy transducer TonB [Flavobacteriales bacterium MED-G15]|nr:MAG: energy transducer TonB [Flavobacteriales bacterium MED-G15]